MDLRAIVFRSRLELAAREEAQAPAGPRPARTPRALRRGSTRDRRLLQRRKTRPRCVRSHVGKAAVDHRDDAIDGDAGLGHVRGKDHLPPIGRGDGAVLLPMGIPGDGAEAPVRIALDGTEYALRYTLGATGWHLAVALL